MDHFTWVLVQTSVLNLFRSQLICFGINEKETSFLDLLFVKNMARRT